MKDILGETFDKSKNDVLPVPELSGSWDIPPFWLIVFFVLPGFSAVLYSLYSLARWVVTGIPAGTEQLFLLLWGLGFGGAGYAVWRVRKRLLTLSSGSDLGEHLGVAEKDVRKTLEHRGIRPKFVVNGTPYYDPIELGGFADLLRPAKQDDTSLLRAVEPDSLNKDNLVRPAVDEGANQADQVPARHAGLML